MEITRRAEGGIQRDTRGYADLCLNNANVGILTSTRPFGSTTPTLFDWTSSNTRGAARVKGFDFGGVRQADTEMNP